MINKPHQQTNGGKHFAIQRKSRVINHSDAAPSKNDIANWAEFDHWHCLFFAPFFRFRFRVQQIAINNKILFHPERFEGAGKYTQ